MPVTLSQMVANEKSLSLTVGSDTLNITYYPNKVTTAAIVEIDSTIESPSQVLSGVIKSWDLLNDDGSMYPLDAPSLAALGIGLLMQISQAIVRDIRPN